jgi:hypothetical protein
MNILLFECDACDTVKQVVFESIQPTKCTVFCRYNGKVLVFLVGTKGLHFVRFVHCGQQNIVRYVGTDLNWVFTRQETKNTVIFLATKAI